MRKIYLLVLSISFLVVFSNPIHSMNVEEPSVIAEFETSKEDIIYFIDVFMERRTRGLITRKDKSEINKIEIIVNNGVFESVEIFNAEVNAIDELFDRRDILSNRGIKYVNNETNITFLSAKVEEDVVFVTIEELSKLYYDRVSEPTFTAWTIERVFGFKKTDMGWMLISQKIAHDSDPVPSNEPIGLSKDTMIDTLDKLDNLDKVNDLTTRYSLEIVTSTNSGSYSNQSAANYAINWWNSRNPAYRSFDADCTNFISQALYAGGWTYVSGYYLNSSSWWYSSLIQSRSWINVSYWYDFTCNNSGRTTILSNPQSLIVGEILQCDFEGDNSKDHSMIVTARYLDVVCLTYHTNDTLNRSFDEIAMLYPNAIWYPHLVHTSYN